MYFDQMGYLQIMLQDLHFAQNIKNYLNLPLPSTAHLLVSFAQWHKFQIIIILLFPFNLWACCCLNLLMMVRLKISLPLLVLNPPPVLSQLAWSSSFYDLHHAWHIFVESCKTGFQPNLQIAKHSYNQNPHILECSGRESCHQKKYAGLWEEVQKPKPSTKASWQSI